MTVEWGTNGAGLAIRGRLGRPPALEQHSSGSHAGPLRRPWGYNTLLHCGACT